MWHCCKNTFLSVARINHELLVLNARSKGMVTMSAQKLGILLKIGIIDS
jgi:hypothetical protein